MPSNTVKKSVRFEPQAIAILEAYAATHQCTQTEALNAIILASAATQVPPTIATQLDDQWKRSIEVRLAKLEAATQVPPTIATQVPPTIATQVPPTNDISASTELEALTSTVETTSNEILTEVVEMPSSPSVEPLKLSKKQFKARYGLDDSLESNNIMRLAQQSAATSQGYTAEDGLVWYKEPNSLWVTEPSA